ncbi:MAG TPA: DUF4339 domain-containing protein [Methyloceanibacter sp.]|nr:DUF4339 domain-containing protein [Methyloceanibacter sp.]
MQDQQPDIIAAQDAAAWYLTRGDTQYGPLADRELLLLAERGGLRADDLLWKAGFDGWKPVGVVCDLATDKAAPPPAEALLQPMAVASTKPRMPKPSLKEKLYDELRKFLMMFSYLWLVFSVFLIHEWMVLASHQVSFRFYGLALVNALVLAKIMLIAEELKFADRFKDKPLVYPIAFKSIAFSVLLVAAYIAEEIAVGMFHGKSAAQSFPQIGGGGSMGVVAFGVILCAALVPFFGFREIARAIGEAKFRALMLGDARERRGPALAPAE